jgi:hypothetical protein
MAAAVVVCCADTGPRGPFATAWCGAGAAVVAGASPRNRAARKAAAPADTRTTIRSARALDVMAS